MPAGRYVWMGLSGCAGVGGYFSKKQGVGAVRRWGLVLLTCFHVVKRCTTTHFSLRGYDGSSYRASED